jgi:hypothetical protein
MIYILESGNFMSKKMKQKKPETIVCNIEQISIKTKVRKSGGYRRCLLA